MPNPLSKIKILLIEDRSDWQNILRKNLEEIFSEFVEDYIEIAESYEQAVNLLSANTYHLVTLDLQIKGDQGDKYSGNSILEIIRNEDSKNKESGLIIVTAYGTEKNLMNQIGTIYRVEKCIVKDVYNPDAFAKAARKAVFDFLRATAGHKTQNRTVLELKLDAQGKIWEGNLKGISIEKSSPVKPAIKMDVNRLRKEGEQLQEEINLKAKGSWRRKAKKFGGEIYRQLKSNPEISSLLATAVREAKYSDGYFHLQLTSPAKHLNLPLELMFKDDYLIFENILTRKLTGIESDPTPFLKFLTGLRRNGQPLKAVIIGANLGDQDLSCEQEAEEIGSLLKKNLKILGLNEAVEILTGEKKATYEKLYSHLHDGCHLLHFAGHSNNLKTIPEESPIHLYDRALKAIDLKLLLQKKQTQFVFLNSCLGARAGRQVGKGGYWGFMDTLASCGIPAVLSYRWEAEDISAKIFSRYFYENLFRTFCPAESLFHARNQASIELGRNEDIWASLVLLMQNL